MIGRGAAVGVAFQRIKMAGFFAWLTWLFVHLFFLIGFRNRLVVLLNWAYSYVTYRRAARLITWNPPGIVREPEVAAAEVAERGIERGRAPLPAEQSPSIH